jgi:hypothetical protein
MRFLSVTGSGNPAPNDQFFPWVAAASNGNLYAIWFDRRLDPANIRINTWEAGRQRRRHLDQPPDQHPVLEPNLGFFSSGAFIGTTTASR